MTHIHYKFSSKLSYATVVFDGPHVTLTDLKEEIMGRERLRAGDCELQITDAQTKEEYTNEEGLIPKGSSVIVKRVPNMKVKSGSVKKIQITERSDAHSHVASGDIKAMDDQSSSKTLRFFSKMVNLAAADVSEDDKIKVVMNQSSYDPGIYNRKFGGVLPANYTCYRCGNTGHHIRKCPSSGDKNFDMPKIKKSTGIPRSFMVEVDDPTIKGAMMTNCGRFAIPAIDAQAYAIGKKEKYPFLVQEESEPKDVEVPVPEELQCLICHDLLVDSVVIPCCGNSYCDECIRTALLDSEGHICPTCNQADVSPDTLIANKFLRQAVNNFKKEKGDTSSVKRNSGIPQSLTATPTPIVVPTPLTVQQHKIQLSTPSQKTDFQESGDHPVSSLPPCVEAEVKTQDDSVADVPFSNKDTTPVPSQPMILVHNDQEQKSSSQTPTSLHSSSSSSVVPMGVATEIRHLPPSSSSQPPAPLPFFPTHHFHSFPPAQQYPRHPVALPNWIHLNPPGATLPPLISSSSSSSSSIPPLIQSDWSSHNRHRRERSPHKRSTYRRSSRSKSKSSRSSSRSSRSRSRSHGRSRARSPYSRHREPHTRTNPSRSYSYGYKRSHSPTPSSSSSPRDGSHSTSQSDHRRKRHQNKKSSHRSYKSRRRAEHSPDSSREAEGHSGQCDANEPTSSQDPNNDFYQQWKKQYKEWYEKYFSTYVSHYHRLPPPLHSLPPPPNPPWADGAENHSSYKLDSFSQLQQTGMTLTHPNTPPSQSSSDSRSSHSQSSSEGRSPLSQSSSARSDTHSRSPCDNPSPPSKRGSGKKDGRKQGATANAEQVPVIKSEQERMKKYDKDVAEDNRCSPETARSKGKKDKRRDRTTCRDSLPDRDAFDSVQKPLKSNKNEREKQERSESRCKKGKDSKSSRQDEERYQKAKSREKPHKVEKDAHLEVYKALKTQRKGKRVCEEENKEKSHITTESSGYLQTNFEITKGECPQPVDKEKQKEQKKDRLSPKVKNIWEEGMQVKPRKKIGININLDRQRPEEKTAIQEWSRSERSDAKEDDEKVDAEIPTTATQQATDLQELRGADKVDETESKKEDEWQKENEEDVSMRNDDGRKDVGEDESIRNDDGRKETGNVKDNEEDERATNGEKESQILKESEDDGKRVTNDNGAKESQIVKENEEDDSVINDDIGKERVCVKGIEEDDNVTNDERAKEKGKSVAATEKMTTEEENSEVLAEESKPKEELVAGVKMSGEDIASVMTSHSSERPNITVESGCNTSMVDHREGEDSLEGAVEITTHPQEQEHSEEDTLELVQAPLSILDKEHPEEDEQEVLPVVPPSPIMTPGQPEAHGESQMSDGMRTGEENWERNPCLALPRDQCASLTRDTEMEGNVGADTPHDHERDWKGEEDKKVSDTEKETEQELRILPELQSSCLTLHHPDRKDREQEDKIGTSKESHPVHHSEHIKKLQAILDIRSSTMADPDHIYQQLNSDTTESKSSNNNKSLPYLVSPFGREQRPLESSRSSLACKPPDEPVVNLVSKKQREAKPHPPYLSNHSDRSTLKARPQSREELWKRYKLEKMLKESQQDQAAKELQPEKEAAQQSTHEAKLDKAEGEQASSHSSRSSSVKNEHERRPKKHKKDKRQGETELEDLERKHKKSKKHQHSH